MVRGFEMLALGAWRGFAKRARLGWERYAMSAEMTLNFEEMTMRVMNPKAKRNIQSPEKRDERVKEETQGRFGIDWVRASAAQ